MHFVNSSPDYQQFIWELDGKSAWNVRKYTMLHTEPVHEQTNKITCASSKVYIDWPSYSCPRNISAASGCILTKFTLQLSVSRVEGHILSVLWYWYDVFSWNYGPLTKLVLINPVNLVHKNSQQVLVEFQQNFSGTFSIKNRRAYPLHVMIGWFSLSCGPLMWFPRGMPHPLQFVKGFIYQKLLRSQPLNHKHYCSRW